MGISTLKPFAQLTREHVVDGVVAHVAHVHFVAGMTALSGAGVVLLFDASRSR
jgi:hypothetical protein